MSKRPQQIGMHGLTITQHCIDRFVLRYKGLVDISLLSDLYASVSSALKLRGLPMYKLKGHNKLKSGQGVTFVLVNYTIVTCY